MVSDNRVIASSKQYYDAITPYVERDLNRRQIVDQALEMWLNHKNAEGEEKKKHNNNNNNNNNNNQRVSAQGGAGDGT